MIDRSKRIRNAIQDKGLSYAELEKITGVSKSALQRYASGETKKIPVDVIEKIAEATGVESRYLMGWDSEEAATVQKLKDQIAYLEQKNAPNDEVRSEIVEMIRQMSDSQAEKLRDFLKDTLSE